MNFKVSFYAVSDMIANSRNYDILYQDQSDMISTSWTIKATSQTSCRKSESVNKKTLTQNHEKEQRRKRPKEYLMEIKCSDTMDNASNTVIKLIKTTSIV